MGFISAVIFFYVSQNSNGFFFPTALSITVFGICFYAIFWSLALANQIKKGYGVRRIEGFAELFITYSDRNNDIPVYNLKIRNVKFRLNENIYNAFETGEYRVYYFPLLRNEMLSVESLD